MIPKSKKNDNNRNSNKLNRIFDHKIKLMPKQKYVTRKNSNKMTDLYKYNNSIEVDSQIFKKLKKTNKVTFKKKPLSSERIKKNSSQISKKIPLDSITIEKKGQNNINKTDNYLIYDQMSLLNYNNDLLNNESNGSNVKNFLNQNMSYNYDKKIIFNDENEYFNNEEGNNDFNIINTYDIQKFKIFNKEKQNFFAPNINHINNINNNLNLSESSNNYNFNSMKNISKLNNINEIEENMNLKNELDKLQIENSNLKLKMNSLQKNNKYYNRNIDKLEGINNPYNEKKKALAYKKSFESSNIYRNNNKQEEYKSQTIERKNKIASDKNPQQINTIYDSMQFKIKKSKLSLNHNVNKTINLKNNLNINNQSK